MRHALTEAEVRVIRNAPGKGKDLARRFGVSESTVSYIRSGRLHREAGGPIRKARPARKLDDDLVKSIRRARGSTRAIAKRFGVSQSHVSNIRTGRRRAGEARLLVSDGGHDCPDTGFERLRNGIEICLGFCVSCAAHLVWDPDRGKLPICLACDEVDDRGRIRRKVKS